MADKISPSQRTQTVTTHRCNIWLAFIYIHCFISPVINFLVWDGTCKKFDCKKKSAKATTSHPLYCIGAKQCHITFDKDDEQQQGDGVERGGTRIYKTTKFLSSWKKKGVRGWEVRRKKGFIDDDSENRGEYERIFFCYPQRGARIREMCSGQEPLSRFQNMINCLWKVQLKFAEKC